MVTKKRSALITGITGQDGAYLTRFLLALNWSLNLSNGQGIDIRDRVITQLNAALPNLSTPIDFNVPESDFAKGGDSLSPANQLLQSICFYFVVE